ncbi:MarR family transcriptional regulator [Nonomuraea sp. NN258]|uniref:MarR family winged helix-turn-helix transcriptional regulator n=1 Tax=Nonomuraea antri TaxID=2730852 RepID=UPI001569F92B|nr:MarR family transcriptional regulator [Nonomuraea antri]NRQ37958.1 MarR family transcriptional regulator [Nonomuraea antri]
MTHAPEAPIGLILGGGSLLVQVGRELNTETERRLAPHGLTAQQAALLLYAASGQSTPSALKSRLGTDTAGMTRLLDRLAAKGLLRRVRHQEDRRSVVVELTAEGHELAHVLPPVFGAISLAAFSGFSGQEIGQVKDMLERILGNLAAARTAPRPAGDAVSGP